MAKDNKKLVQAITSQEENFAQWYTDICVKAELVEYSSVKGFIILRPYGQAIWELIQKDMDARFKATGHENVAMPVLIPESLLQKEGELVNGFAPEVAWVTMGGSDKLEERLAVRPTSETMFCDHWSRVLHSYRELPMKYNQWCSVVRWEKTTRPFLRSREFWWQEGHTIHETAAEAEAETQQQLNCYADVCEQDLAIPVVKGRKTDKEKFAGAEATYTIEAMMKDGKALQSGTSHYFGDKFSKAYDVTFTGRDNQLHHPYQTSWGVSTRLVGAIIMTHGDDDGLILPPAIAPIQVVVVPIAAHKPGVSEKAAELAEKISKYVKCPEHLICTLEPLPGIRLDCFLDNLGKGLSCPGDQKIPVDPVPAVPEFPSGGQMIKGGSHTVDIRLLIHPGISAYGTVRRTVQGNDILLRRGISIRIAKDCVLIEVKRNVKINETDISLGRQHKIGRLDVPVDHRRILAVQIIKRAADLLKTNRIAIMRMLRLPTVISLLNTGFHLMFQHRPLFFMFCDLHKQ